MNTWKENNSLRRIKEYYDDYEHSEIESYPIDYGYFVVAITEDDLNLLKSDDHKKQKDAFTRAYIVSAYTEDLYGDYDVASLDSRNGEVSRKGAINWFNTDFAQEVISTKPSKDWKFVLVYLEGEDLLTDLTWEYEYIDTLVAEETYWSPAEYETEVIEDSIRMLIGDYEIVGPNTDVKALLKELKSTNKENTKGIITVLEDDSWVEDDSYQVDFNIIEELPR